MSGFTIKELREIIVDELEAAWFDEDEWITASDICRRHRLGHGWYFYRVATVLERLAHEGVAEIRNPASRGRRYFRRAA